MPCSHGHCDQNLSLLVHRIEVLVNSPSNPLAHILKCQAEKNLSSSFVTIFLTGHGSSVGRVFASQASVLRSILAFSTFFRGKIFPSSADSRASCQLLAKEWVLNTDKLPLGGLPRNSVVK